MSDKKQRTSKYNATEQESEESDGIEMPKTKKGKPRKPYVMTQARIEAFARCRAKKDEYLQKMREKKQKGEIIKEPIAKTLNKYQALKNKLKVQGVEVEDEEPIKVTSRLHVEGSMQSMSALKAPKKQVKVVDEESDVEQIIIKKKPKPKVKKQVIIYQSDSEDDSKHYNSPDEEVVVRKPKPIIKQPKLQPQPEPDPPIMNEPPKFMLRFA